MNKFLILIFYPFSLLGQVFFIAPTSGKNKDIYYDSRVYKLNDSLPILDFDLKRYDFKAKKYIFCFNLLKIKKVVEIKGIKDEILYKWAIANRKINYSLLKENCLEPLSKEKVYKSESYGGITVQFKDKVKSYRLLDAIKTGLLTNDSIEIDLKNKRIKWRKKKMTIDEYAIVEAEYFNGEKEVYIAFSANPVEGYTYIWNVIVKDSKIEFIEFID